MSRINPALIAKLKTKLNVGTARVYALIGGTVRRTSLPRDIAAIVLARDAGLSIGQFASHEDLALIRQTENQSHFAASPVPPLPSSSGRISTAKPMRSRTTNNGKPKRKGNAIFVVHGRNDKLRRAMFAFLRSIGLQPIEWNKALALTGKGSPYVGEVLEAAFSKAIATVVLFTPDDEAKLKDEFLKRGEPSFERRLTGQPRPNVLFEAGMAFASRPNHTVLVHVGRIRPISDIAGRHLVNLTNSVESRHQLVVKLRAAGCPVDDTGDDWQTEGNFTV